MTSVKENVVHAAAAATDGILIPNSTVFEKCKLLVVGAGGIGCELLKNLVLSGFRKITVIDLDTIDVSNLNRQFLFRRRHVGHSKAEVAKESVERFNPSASITAIHGNIKDSKFGLTFFQTFDAVLNALDNIDARKHVNRLCLSASIPLIEAGSTGYTGQVSVIFDGETECYECHDKGRQKSYPVCTIRSTPEKPEHCIAWAKYLFGVLFGPVNEDNMLADLRDEIQTVTRSSSIMNDDTGNTGNTEDTDVIGDMGNEVAKSLAKIPTCPEENGSESVASSLSTSSPSSFALMVRRHLFENEVRKHAAMLDAWVFKDPPIPLLSTMFTEQPIPNSAVEVSSIPSNPEHQPQQHTIGQEHSVWSLPDCGRRFCESIVHMQTERAEECGSAVFDKDDEVAIDFVTAAANLRMENYRIPRMSRWDVKSIAGSIIPAIASTNAIVAGLQVVQLLHVLEWKQNCNTGGPDATDAKQRTPIRDSKARFVWVRQYPSGKFISAPEAIEPPNPRCFVCQQQRAVVALHSLQEWTLESFVRHVLRGGLCCSEPLVEMAMSQKCIYDPETEEDEEDSEIRAAQLRMSLVDWDIVDGTTLIVTDISQGNFQCDLIVREDLSIDKDKVPECFVLSSTPVATPSEEDQVMTKENENEGDREKGNDDSKEGNDDETIEVEDNDENEDNEDVEISLVNGAANEQLNDLTRTADENLSSARKRIRVCLEGDEEPAKKSRSHVC